MDFNQIVINKFNKIYSINLKEADEIDIKKMIFPNYYKQEILNIFKEKEYRGFEYCRIINKIFGFNYLETNLSYYETPEIPIEKNDIVFDCGANTGIFSLYSAYKAKQIFSFEPSTLIRHYLRNTQKYNNNIIIVPAGLSYINKEDFFYQTDNPGAARLIDFKVPECHDILYKEKIKIITIDKFVEKTKNIPNFIKMDIENGEFDALKGAKNTILKYMPKCSISIHEENIKNIENIKTLFPKSYNFYIKKENFYDSLLICIPNKKEILCQI